MNLKMRRVVRHNRIDVYNWAHGAWHLLYSKPRLAFA